MNSNKIFKKSLDEFVLTSTSCKGNIVRFLHNNFKENIHYKKLNYQKLKEDLL